MGMMSAAINSAGAAFSSLTSAAQTAQGLAHSVATNVGGAASTQMVGNTVGQSMDEGAMAAENAMTKANDIQNRLAIVSATMQVAALARSMMMQTLRDMIKDAKDTVKDQGEAGHKP